MREPMLYPAISNYKKFAVSIQQIVEADPLSYALIVGHTPRKSSCSCTDAAGRLNSMLARSKSSVFARANCCI
jgi:hypothetical protein